MKLKPAANIHMDLFYKIIYNAKSLLPYRWLMLLLLLHALLNESPIMNLMPALCYLVVLIHIYFFPVLAIMQNPLLLETLVNKLCFMLLPKLNPISHKWESFIYK